MYENFLQQFIRETQNLKVGDPNDLEVFMGALNSQIHLEKVIRYLCYKNHSDTLIFLYRIGRIIQKSLLCIYYFTFRYAKLAKEEGGTINCGYGANGSSLNLPSHLQNGYFFPPTIVTNLAKGARCLREEVFGPFVCISKFATELEAIELANDVEYGLCASVWSENVGTIHRVSHELEVGTVWNNCWLIRSLHMPFGGCKQSGIGREGITHSLETYTNEKTVCIKIN